MLVALLAGVAVTVRAATPGLLLVAELADTALAPFHNALFPYAADQIVDDHGVRLGSIGSDIFRSSGDSPNEFWTVTDRGPNGNPGRRTFLTPKFNPFIAYVRVQGTSIQILRAIPILDASGLPVSGLSNVSGFDETPWNFNNTVQDVPFNPNGLDTEGLVRTSNGDFWLVDEYSPSLVHVDATGRIVDRFVPVDSLLASTLATTPNYRVKKTLPKILNARRQNRGFEGIALTPDQSTLFIAMQSPLEYPTRTLGRASRNVRILRFDIVSEQVTGEFVYQMDEVCSFLRQPVGCAVAPGEMKLSGLVALSASSFIVDERTDAVAKVYRVDVTGATNILRSVWDDVATTPTDSTRALETLADPASQGVALLRKSLVIDLSTLPGMPDKIEGMALAQGDVLVVANDNDFGLVDEATFNARGRLSNDTGVKSKLLFIQLANPLY